MNSIETITDPRISSGTGTPVFGAASVLAADATATVRTAATAGFAAGATDRERATGTRPGSPPT